MSVQQEKFKAIADKIRERTGTTEKIKPNDFVDKIDDVYEVAHSNGYDEGHNEGYREGKVAGYDDGYKDGFNDGENEGYGNGYEAGDIDGYVAGLESGIKKGYEQGKTEERSKMWDRLLRNGECTYYNGFFAGYWWGWDNFYPNHDIKVVGDGTRLFYNWNAYNEAGSLKARLEECGVMLDISGQNRFNNMFAYSPFTELPTLEFKQRDTASVTYCSNVFYACAELITIEKIITTKDIIYTAWFGRCSKLTKLKFEGEIGKSIDVSSCPLDKESQISVFTHLCTDEDVTGQTLTLKKSAVNEAFGINVDDETTYPVGSEYYELRYSRPNWTIAYV